MTSPVKPGAIEAIRAVNAKWVEVTEGIPARERLNPDAMDVRTLLALFDQQTLALDSARRELANALAHTELDMEMLGAARDELKEARGALERMERELRRLRNNSMRPPVCVIAEMHEWVCAALSPTKAGTTGGKDHG